MNRMTTAQAATINRGQALQGLLLSLPLVVFLMRDSLAQTANPATKLILAFGLVITLSHALRGFWRQNSGNVIADAPHIANRKWTALLVGFPVLAVIWAVVIGDTFGMMVFGFFTVLTCIAATVNGPYRPS